MIYICIHIYINKKITGFTHLKPKYHWDLLLKIVFRQNLLYFASLIMFMDGLYLGNHFQTLFLSFYCFYCCCCLVGVAVVVSCFVILLLLSYFFIILVLILCVCVRYYFVRLLGIIINVRGECRTFYVIFNICNSSITLFSALSWILFSYLLTVSLTKFRYNIIVMTILL